MPVVAVAALQMPARNQPACANSELYIEGVPRETIFN
jgi:hypothetical protein